MQLVPKIKRYLGSRPLTAEAVCAFVLLLISVLEWFQLEVQLYAGMEVLQLPIGQIALNIALVLLLNLLLVLLTGRWHTALYVTGPFFAVLAVVNHYVWRFRAAPLSLWDILDAGTAADVIRGYSFKIGSKVIFACLALAFIFACALLLKQIESDGKRYAWSSGKWRLCLTALAALGCYAGMRPLLQDDLMVNWELETKWNGYVATLVKEFAYIRDSIRMPDGYDTAMLEELAAQPRKGDTVPAKAEMPDIVLILNETFYDLEHYTDLETDGPVLANWNHTQNCIRGYAVVPDIGSGTNASEFELLTGNTLEMMNVNSPFNALNFGGGYGVQNSIATYLKHLGYSTCAMHPATGTNYNRFEGYPGLGFEEVHFLEDFQHIEFYGERTTTDAGAYKDMERWYEAAGEGPRLLYLLTLQNHGGYDQNDASYDTVHAGLDFGEYTQEVNEYLSSVSLSDQAFADLLAYFSAQDRPVVVCMVGDHAPSFIESLPVYGDRGGTDPEVLKRAVPFMIWANPQFGSLETGADLLCTMPDLIPMLLQQTDLPLSVFYDTIAALHEQIPVRLRSGVYYTAAGNSGRFVKDDPRFAVLAPYYYMAYNNLQNKNERIQDLFDPPEMSSK